jgi:hypothetical protein
MWGEGVNQDNFDNAVWASAAAVAERLWSNPDQTADASKAEPRLEALLCQFSRRGYRPGPINRGFCPTDAE